METHMAQALETTNKEKWANVQVYTPTHICTGYVYCYHQQRLLDVLNGIAMGAQGVKFLPVREAEICSPYGQEATVQSMHINKANILFVREIGDGQRGLGGDAGHKRYPYVAKPFTKAVRLYMQLYTLVGLIHCTARRQVSGVLNSEPSFLAMTDVEICPVAGSSESGVSFLAVNKEHIISLVELDEAAPQTG